MKNLCEYCAKYNGDGIEETGGLDYYSCELMNKKDLKKYGSYSPLENQVDEEECSYPLGEKCKYKERLEK